MIQFKFFESMNACKKIVLNYAVANGDRIVDMPGIEKCNSPERMRPLVAEVFELHSEEEQLLVNDFNATGTVLNRMKVLDLCKWRVMDSNCNADYECTYSRRCDNGKCRIDWPNVSKHLMNCSYNLFVICF